MDIKTLRHVEMCHNDPLNLYKSGATAALSQVKPGLTKIFYQGSVFSNDLSPSPGLIKERE